MKTHFITSAVALVAAVLVSVPVSAATPPSADLVVKGTITVPSCDVSYASGGEFAYDNISTKLINPTTTYNLGIKSDSLTVTCSADTYLTFKVTDLRDGTASATGLEKFGLGPINTDGKIGYYTVAVKNPRVDTASASTYLTTGNTFTTAATVSLNKGSFTGWATSSNVQKAGKVFTADLDVQAYLASSKDMKGVPTEDVDLDGKLRLDFQYGL